MARNETLDVGLCMKCNQAVSKPGSVPPSSRICSNSKKRGDSHSNGWVEKVIDKKRKGWRVPSCLTPFSTRRKLCLLGLCCKSRFTLPRENFHEHTIDQGRCRDFQKQGEIFENAPLHIWIRAETEAFGSGSPGDSFSPFEPEDGAELRWLD